MLMLIKPTYDHSGPLFQFSTRLSSSISLFTRTIRQRNIGKTCSYLYCKISSNEMVILELIQYSNAIT
jgi:hypothetical protein